MTRRDPPIMFVPVTHELVKRYYGHEPLYSLKGFAAVCEGEPVGLLGAYYLKRNMLVVFSEFKSRFRGRKKAIVQGIHLLREFIRDLRCPVWAVAQKDERASDTLLQRLGFEPTARDTEMGRLYFRSA